MEQSGLARCRPRRGAVEDARPARTRSTLEKCDLGKGPGVVDGAFAELPRYFADADKVMDLETRLLWCMEKLQGFNRADLVKRPHPAGGQPVKDLGAIATYVASKSSGMKFAAKLDTPQEKAVGRRSARRCSSGARARTISPARPVTTTPASASGCRDCRICRSPEEAKQVDRRMAGLPGVDHACDDHAAPALRLLLADADAGAGNGIGRQRRADRLSRPRTPRAARSPLRA